MGMALPSHFQATLRLVLLGFLDVKLEWLLVHLTPLQPTRMDWELISCRMSGSVDLRTRSSGFTV